MEDKSTTPISICLNCYKIRFNEKNKPTQKTIVEVFGTDDIIKISNDFVKVIDLKKVFKNKKEDRILYLKNSYNPSKNKNYYSGIIMKGHSGPQTAIDELVKGEAKTVATINKNQYHCLPYYFLLYINKKNPKDILFLAQSYRQYGFKDVFEDAFREFIKNTSNEINVKFNTLSVASLYKKYISDGNINKVRFIKYGLIKSAEQVVKGDNYKDDNYEMELSIKSKNGFKYLKSHLNYDDASFIEQVQIDGFDYNEIYADIIVAGRKRSINVTKPSQFSAAYEITDKVRIDKNTYLPDFNEIHLQAIDILENDLIPYI